MAEKKERLKFIREEPWIARTLRTIRPLRIIPEDLHNWLFDWIEDIGLVMRSREMMVSFLASLGYYVVLLSLLSTMEATGVAPGLIKRVKGIFKI